MNMYIQCPCVDCITLAMCKARFIEHKHLWVISSYCKHLEEFLLDDVIPSNRGVTYWMFKENRERTIKEFFSGKPYGSKNETSM